MDTTSSTVTTRYSAIICTSKYLTIWTAIIYGYKFLMMVFGAFLAWETRHVAIKELNDSKLIGVCIYNVFILSVAGVLTSSISANPVSSFILIASFIIFCTSITTIVIFAPKVSYNNF